MAAITAAAVVVAPAAAARKVSLKARAAGKASASFVSNGSKVEMMQVWQPFNNRKYETMSFLPQLTDAEIAKQVEYMVKSGWAPCIEFEAAENAFVTRKLGTDDGPCYYDNRYWVMYKLPMFGCTDASQVLTEIANCKREFPNCFVRVVAFDSTKQVQMASFIVVKPK